MPIPCRAILVALLIALQVLGIAAPGRILCIQLRPCSSHVPAQTASAEPHAHVHEHCTDHHDGPARLLVHEHEDCGCHLHLPLPCEDWSPCGASKQFSAELSAIAALQAPASAVAWSPAGGFAPARIPRPPDTAALAASRGLATTRLLI